MNETIHAKYPLLFSELPLGAVTLRNRIVMPPMATNMGVTTPRARAFYAARAKGGAGLVIVEGTWVEHFSQDAFKRDLAKLAEAIHKDGAAAVVQLFKPPRYGDEEVWVSADADRRAATTEEVEQIPELFAEAAAGCQEAGFDGAEVHGAHSFFFNQFFSPRDNRREDEYGGTLENRMRLGIETVAAMRAEVRPDFLLLYRHTAEEFAEGGYSLEDSLAFVPELQQAGLNILDVSPSSAPGPAEHAGLAAALRQSVSIPVIAVGGMNDPAKAEETLRDKKAHLVAIGRGLIADPEWPNKVRAGHEAKIVECIEDNVKCYGNLGRGEPISCTQNPSAGFEIQDYEE